MQDTEIFLSLAEIAGVFVGFGALIAVRGGGVSDAFEVAWMRSVVSLGLMTVLAGLAPVVISRYGLTAHEVWALSSLLVLVCTVGTIAANNLMPEAQVADEPIRRSVKVVRGAVWVPSMLLLLLGPIAILLGVAPVREEALYLTVVALLLLWSAISLLLLVFAGRRPQSVSGPANA